MFPPFLPVLGAEISFGVVILIISIISWLYNLFQDKKPPIQPRNKPKPKNSSQAELERFLREVEQKNESDRERPPAPKPRPAQAEKKKPKPSPPVKSQVAAPRNTQPSRPTRLADTRLTPSALGEGVRTHVASHMEPRNVDRRVESDIDDGVRRDIDSNIQRDLGSGLGKDSTMTAQKVEVVHPLVQALRNPQGVRQAILLAEIMNRPKSKR